jgi:predicted lipid-binding transport protein (Tim44 family)
MGDGFQFIDIILFAMIAAFLVLRLRSVLGRRDGHEGGYRDPFKTKPGEESTEGKVVPFVDRAKTFHEEGAAAKNAREDAEVGEVKIGEDVLSKGIADIHKADPRFNAKDFLTGARAAFEMILEAYAKGDAQTLKPLLNAEVFADFAQAIKDREQAGETLEDTLVGIKSADVVEAYMEGRMAHVTVKFVSEQINVTRDEKGDVVDGNPNAVIEVTDFWTFSRDARSRDVNWTLIATNSLD